MKKCSGAVVYSSSDLIRYSASSFASSKDRHNLENPDGVRSGEETDDQELLAQTSDRHGISVLTGLKMGTSQLVEVRTDDFGDAHTKMLSAISAKVPFTFEAASDAG
jgi:hypothetical protein